MKTFNYFRIANLLIFLSFTHPTISAQTYVNTNANLMGVNLSSTVWGDIDNDGDLDVAICGQVNGSGNGFTAIYENQAGNFVALPAQNFSQPLPQIKGPTWNLLEWGDYNNDNRLDLLLAGRDSDDSLHLEIWRNDGNLSFSYVTSLAQGLLVWDVEWVDADNDGDQDIFVSGNNLGTHDSFLFFNNHNQGSASFTASTDLFPTMSSAKVEFGDYDKDGDLDLAFCGRVPGSTFNTQLWDNDGTGHFSHNTNAVLTGLHWGTLDWGDIDQDGDPDLLTSGFAGQSPEARIYYATGGSNPLGQSLGGFPGGNFSSSSLADYDHDGDLDMLLQGDSTYNMFQVYTRVYENQGNPPAMVYDPVVSLLLPDQLQGEVKFLDYDGNGTVDIFCSGLNSISQARLFSNTDTSMVNMPPNAPTGLVGTPVGTDAINFTWNAPLDDVTPSIALTYHLMVSDANGNVNSPLADTATGRRTLAALGDIMGTSWTLRGVQPNQTYCARVSAIDAGLAGSAFSESTCALVVGLDQAMNRFTVNAWPVPARERLNLRVEGVSQGGRVQIHSLSGQVLVEQRADQLDHLVLDVSSLSTGMYLVNVQLEGEDQITSLKFFKR